jgi:hypothetical protein
MDDCCSNYGTVLGADKKYYCKYCYEESEEETEEEETDDDDEKIIFNENIYPEQLKQDTPIISNEFYYKLNKSNKDILHSLFDDIEELVIQLENLEWISSTYLPKNTLLIVKEYIVYIFRETTYEYKIRTEYETVLGFPLTKNSIYIN